VTSRGPLVGDPHEVGTPSLFPELEAHRPVTWADGEPYRLAGKPLVTPRQRKSEESLAFAHRRRRLPVNRP
jgi:hypothetical protein